MEQNNYSLKIMQKKIMIIALCLSLFLLIISALCAISEASRPTTYGIILGLSFSWFSLFILWLLFIYNWKWKIKISIFAGVFLWIIRTFFLLVVFLIIVFFILENFETTNSKLQILLFALFSYLIPMFTIFIFWIEEIFLSYKKKNS